ncbi:unnamed protein product [Acidocella sp. C78]|uniref:TetR family transcriptional regulator n=1 Tax=Acidocella sp. C78 TaxID=1671486 RepID=UPI00191B9B96|nr:TetR family transcriptional regulator [Acidocella sp. C78]CAG4904881.1 unnamed protein product [Acidocella sp. C78]
MSSTERFEQDLVAAAFDLGASQGWRRVTAAAAARHGGLDLDRARRSFACTGMILARFGRLADMHALHGAASDGAVRDRLFDIVMRRIDFLQQHRAGVIALLRHVPTDPLLACWLARANLASMGWMLEGAGVSAAGLRGALRKRGLLAVWAWTVRAWLRDDSEDLSATMAALDTALTRAEQAALQLNGTRPLAADPGDDASFTPEPDLSADPAEGI